MSVVSGPPLAPTQPSPPSSTAPPAPWWQSRTLRFVISGILLLTAVAVFFIARANSSSASVALIGKDATGADPFTPSVASSQDLGAAALAEPNANVADGDAAGLYAGQRNVPSCNASQLAGYLDANPAKEKAWAQAVNLQAADVRPFIATLTSVLLRVDTRVTEYRFANNQPQAHQSVLEAGTAVMLDRTGFPRVRCQSGNPLGKPRAVDSSSYTGTKWRGFSPRRVVTVRPAKSTAPFILLDSPTGSIFVRIPGGIADVDRPPVGVTIQLCEPGGPFGVTGSRFPAGAAITLAWDNPAVTLANVTADGAGNFSVQVTCPPGAPVGAHLVTATGGGVALAQPVYAIPPAPGP